MKDTIRRFVPSPIWRAARRVKRNIEFKKIKAQKPITKDQLVEDLTAMGLKKGDVLFVHSSLRSLGFVDGGPNTVIDALMDVVGPEGTLAFPTYTIFGGMKETVESGEFVFDPASSPSTVGKVTEVFRTRPGVKRSLHPTHSVAAWGCLAEEMTGTHLEDGTNFGPASPFGKLVEHNGKVMGLGINFGPVTFYHVYEDTNLDKFPGVYHKEEFRAKIRLPDGDREVTVRCHDPVYHSRRIDKTPEIEAYIGEFFQSTGAAHIGPVGNSNSWWISAREMLEKIDELYAQGVTIYKTPNLKTEETTS